MRRISNDRLLSDPGFREALRGRVHGLVRDGIKEWDEAGSTGWSGALRVATTVASVLLASISPPLSQEAREMEGKAKQTTTTLIGSVPGSITASSSGTLSISLDERLKIARDIQYDGLQEVVLRDNRVIEMLRQYLDKVSESGSTSTPGREPQPGLPSLSAWNETRTLSRADVNMIVQAMQPPPPARNSDSTGPVVQTPIDTSAITQAIANATERLAISIINLGQARAQPAPPPPINNIYCTKCPSEAPVERLTPPPPEPQIKTTPVTPPPGHAGGTAGDKQAEADKPTADKLTALAGKVDALTKNFRSLYGLSQSAVFVVSETGATVCQVLQMVNDEGEIVPRRLQLEALPGGMMFAIDCNTNVKSGPFSLKKNVPQVKDNIELILVMIEPKPFYRRGLADYVVVARLTTSKK